MRRALIYFAAIVITAALALALSPAVLAQPTSQWDALNDNCRGEPILRSNGRDNPACAKRDRLSRELIAQDWLQGNHDVWVSPDKMQAFIDTMNFYNRQIEANLYAAHSIMPAMIQTLRARLTDAELFAAWNHLYAEATRDAPYAASVGLAGMQHLERQLSQKHDPRYRLER